jgi:methyltransferase family protein
MKLFHRAFELAHFANPGGGSCLEFGVFKGNSYCHQAREIRRRFPNSSLVGFDSWQGLPEETEGVWAPSRHDPGELCAPKNLVLGKLSRLGITPDEKRFRLVDGFFSDSLTPELRETIDPPIFLNIDVDIHRSTIELLEWVRPILRPGCILYWDDWKDPNDEAEGDWGEHLAWEQWYNGEDGVTVETIEVNPVGQRTMIVTEVDGRRLAPPQPSMRDIRFEALALADKQLGLRAYALGFMKNRINRFPRLRGAAIRIADKILVSR